MGTETSWNISFFSGQRAKETDNIHIHPILETVRDSCCSPLFFPVGKSQLQTWNVHRISYGGVFFRYPPPIKWSDEWRDVIQGALGKRWFHMDVHGVKYLPSPLVSLRSSSLKKYPNETFCWTSCYVLVVQKILPEIRRIFRSGNWFPHVMICSLLCK